MTFNQQHISYCASIDQHQGIIPDSMLETMHQSRHMVKWKIYLSIKISYTDKPNSKKTIPIPLKSAAEAIVGQHTPTPQSLRVHEQHDLILTAQQSKTVPTAIQGKMEKKGKLTALGNGRCIEISLMFQQ